MTDAHVERRLAKVLAADVAGYSRLMRAEVEPGRVFAPDNGTVEIEAWRYRAIDQTGITH